MRCMHQQLHPRSLILTSHACAPDPFIFVLIRFSEDTIDIAKQVDERVPHEDANTPNIFLERCSDGNTNHSVKGVH